jgi:DNA gyrase subunit A
MVKKTRLPEYDSNRSGGVIAINLRDGDEVISATLCSSDEDLLLVSRKGQSVRFHADDATLRPMARATQGVIGMKFRGNDALLAMDVVRDDAYVVTVTDGGFGKRTSVGEWSPKGRGILGVKAMRLASDERGSLVGAIVAHEADEIFAIKSSGEVIRTSVGEIRATGRDTMGVTLTAVGEGDAVVAVTRNPEAAVDDDGSLDTEAEPPAGGAES